MLVVRLAINIRCTTCNASSANMVCKKKDRNRAEVDLRKHALDEGWDVTPLKERCPNCKGTPMVAAPKAASRR